MSQQSRTVSKMPKVGTKLNIPKIDLLLPVLWHPDNDVIEKQIDTIDRPYIVAYFGSEDAASAYIAQRIPAYGGLCYPNAKKDRLFSIQRMMNATTLMDEEFGNPEVQSSDVKCLGLRRHYLAVLDGVPPPPEFPLVRLLFDTLQPIMAHIRPRVGARLVKVIREQVEALAARLRRQIDMLTFESYLELRRIDVFGEWAATLTEYAIDVDVTDELEADSALKKMRNAVIDSVTLINDLFSFRKEVQVQDPVNSLWILMRQNKLDLQGAINRLAQIINENERQIVAAQDRVLAGKLGGRTDVRDYMVELGHLASGNAEFHTFSARYQGLEFTGGRFTSGKVVIEAFPSLHEIAAAKPTSS
jgi:hypothetical protein